ncbi:hypothetical protein D0Z00_000719 [Geotrichum galactomycetum]|uniref:Uncharacterized protein n=1 Tax=Geotrichum galactomycetum TaxID=27317 RepID=A0ACB6V976_9ASCO|nr:hypothetical protein D0Z00_000719 [Geotrichum candidum]
MLVSKGGNNEIDEETGLPKGSSLRSVQLRHNSRTDDIYSPQSNIASPLDHSLGREIKIILPPKHVASELIESVWDNACVLFRFYHRPSFIRDLDLLYETDPDDYTNKQYKILPLVYSVMAVGVLFSMDKCEKLGFKDASEGYKYFVAARKLIDIADARDTYAIQSIVMMIIFLQCSARLSTCYSYIGVALRSALRAGLHRKVAYNFNPIELETRRRLFWTIRKMDIYVNAMLGLPRSTAESDFDQELPEEIDDENITEEAYFPQEKGKLSSAGIANAHTRLITILSHIMKHIYPVKQEEAIDSDSKPLYNVTHTKVAEMEQEIREWLESLPPELKPGTTPPPEYLKANRLLHLALCHIQVVLYRPFIHYCSPKFKRDEKARVSALNCIGVSRRAMYLAHELTSQKLLNGAYWFSIYTIFFSVACLVFYVHENINDPEAVEIRHDAELGKNALTSLKDSSMAAQRTYNLLNTLFEQLNRRTAKMPAYSNEEPVTSTSQQQSVQPHHANFVPPSQATPSAKLAKTQVGTIKTPGKRGRKSKKALAEAAAAATAAAVANVKNPNLGTNNNAGNNNKNANQQQPNLSFNLGDNSDPSFGVTAAAAADAVNGFPIMNNDKTLQNDRLNALANSGGNGSGSSNGSTPTDGKRTESPHFYVPGIMDQVDTQLFGRFLPPYMLQQQQQHSSQVSANNISNNNGGNKPNNNSSGSSDNNDVFSNIDNTGELSWVGNENGNDQSFYTIPVSEWANNNDNNAGGSSGNNDKSGLNNINVDGFNIDFDGVNGQQQKKGNGENNKEHSSKDHSQQQQQQNLPLNENSPQADGSRRFSMSSLFNNSKDWEDLLAQHNELSGLNSFMAQ